MTDQPDPQWAITAARAADDKSGTDIVVLDVGPVLSICQYFVLVSAGNARLVRTIAEEVEEQVSAAGGPRPIRVEGLQDSGWVLLDYGDMVVHVFGDEQRRYYDLDRLWADVERVPWELERSGGSA
ncbi:MAG TPA: ribosome silencing factor [Acidimicrobiales bacterium]|jgi:ribosome-associated protein|nr:ribosome silencing factor [Acidimicrobiales bacterium]HMS89464.1 ribosome silencing factor [Acidimicrobiales bacterium]HRA35444.1 ribosome silencing factor [Acidimicrobiales bacterium]